MFTALAIAQRWLGHPLSAHALSNRGFASLSAFLWFVYIWLSRVQLVTDVDEAGISIRLRGLPRHDRIALTAIGKHSFVAVDPERDFGGIGFRSVPGGRAYVVRAGRGVRLELNGGGFAVIGSARPEELAATITSKP
jgi:hypothetical protein